MRTPFTTLVWKEWREHQWKLASITAVMLGVTSLSMLLAGEDKFGASWGMLLWSAMPLAAFIGLGLAAGERSHGTLPFLQSLPVPLWKAAVAKLLVGFVTIAVPILATVGTFVLWRIAFDQLGIYALSYYIRRDMERNPEWAREMLVMALLAATSLWIWCAAAGLNRKDEISAAAVALAIIIGWSMLILYVSNRLEWFGFDALSDLLLGLAPGGLFAVSNGETQFMGLYFASAIATHLALLVWYVRRFGQVAELEVRSPVAARRQTRKADWLGPPRSSMATAIAWKQFRESGPIAIAGVAAVFGITAVLFALEDPRDYSDTFSFLSVAMGLAIALVVGIGVALNDSKPQQNTFWRSRPINPNQWFWIKYATGLTVVLASIYVPVWLFGGKIPDDPEARLVLPAVHIALFAAAVAMTCLVRQAVYAAILSIGAIFLGMQTTWLAWLAYRWARFGTLKSGVWFFEGSGVPLSGLVLCGVVCTLLAWLAMRNDWGRKTRY